MTSKLFSPFTLKELTLKNRIVMAPMCMYSSEQEDGTLNDFHLMHYTSRAVGQVGLIIIEATAVTAQGRISHRDLGIWDDGHVDGFSKLTKLVKGYGTKIGIQLAHAGRKATVSGEIIAPSPLPFDANSKAPKEMSKADITATIDAFKQGAERASRSGFDVIEIHAAHGYLLHEFLSPLTNHRSDEYGGSLENRYRLLREVIETVKPVWNGPILVRVSANDYDEAGLNPTDFVTMGAWMKEQGVDLIDVSSGGLIPKGVASYPGYQVPFAEKIKHGASIATGAVGLITEPLHAEEILQNERADLILLGRELLRDPYWPRTAAKALGDKIDAPKQYERGW
ncbi:NADPH dehydrogenase NamA [Bacillus sp. DNRA2]|uniref:NADPH dehydrogenase NamA n=1 Tax=Bacillus sp. DNRA2 TaxID=2723053 RepID=UPI00145DBFA1|nr:NADPH dehydrogenase NamA [Bacillus sp. DNRA2]NMD70229.1 NADPH dehydrogenase NamA [Bacillus sp. DNRA2]